MTIYRYFPSKETIERCQRADHSKFTPPTKRSPDAIAKSLGFSGFHNAMEFKKQSLVFKNNPAAWQNLSRLRFRTTQLSTLAKSSQLTNTTKSKTTQPTGRSI